MNRYFLFCALVFFMEACSGSNRFEEAAFQYQVDSTVNARLDSVETKLQQRNDSLILEAARHRVDSLKQNPVAIPTTPPPPPPSASPAIPPVQP